MMSQLTRESVKCQYSAIEPKYPFQTHLVTVAPLVVLGADVLVRVLGALLQRRHVVPVLPMLVPEPVGVGTGGDEAGGDTTSILLAIAIPTQHHDLVNFNFRCSGFEDRFVIRSRVRIRTY